MRTATRFLRFWTLVERPPSIGTSVLRPTTSHTRWFIMAAWEGANNRVKQSGVTPFHLTDDAGKSVCNLSRAEHGTEVLSSRQLAICPSICMVVVGGAGLSANHRFIVGIAAIAACSPNSISFFALSNESHDMLPTGGVITTLEYLRQSFSTRELMT